jgi:5'-deoxynucleotidase YfbR-like HD superfamily hydrolase
MKDFFICHASEDKKDYIFPIKNGLEKIGISTWIDNGEIDLGDNILLKIQEGINNSKYALIVISQIWLEKNWPLYELSSLLCREIRKGQTFVIPLIIGEKDLILDKLPSLEAKYCIYFTSVERTIIELSEFINRKKQNVTTNISKNITIRDCDDLFQYIENISKTINHIDNSSFNDNSDVFRHILRIDNMLIKENNIFEYINEIIQKSTSKYPLSVIGYPGTGKTKFLILLYLYFKLLFKEKRNNKIPIYVNLNNYDQYEFEKSHEYFKKDFEPINDFISRNQNSYIFIIDGFNDYFKRTTDNDIKLIEFLDNFSHVRIVGSNISDGKYLKINKNRNIPNSEFEIQITSVDKSNVKFNDFIKAYVKTKCNSQIANEIKENLFNVIKDIGITSFDLFTVNLLYKKVTNRNYGYCKNLIELIEEYIINQNVAMKRSVSIEQLSEIAFKVFMEGKQTGFDTKYLSPIFQNNFVVRDFLLANYAINNLLNKQRRDVYNKVFPYEVNRFCKLLMNANQTTEKDIYNTIEELLKENDIQINTKTHFCYLLGRIENERLALKAIRILKKIKDEYENISDFDKEKLLLLRTIYISLIFLGKFDNNYITYSNEYLKRLLESGIWNNLNRGFHLEYYGDILINPNEPDLLQHEDDLRSCENTFDRLYYKISEYLNNPANSYPLFELEVFTICSLIQQRTVFQKTVLDQDIYDKYGLIINRILDNQTIHISELLLKYLEMLKVNISNSIPSIVQFAYDLFHIKTNLRAGWIESSAKRTESSVNIKRTESVADHTMGTIILAKLFLPELISNESKYKKNKVIDILLFHDLAEAYTTDIPQYRKGSPYSELEKKAINYISMISSYDKIGNLIDIQENWSAFEGYAESDINYKIAKDIDKLENLLQLYIYQDHMESSIFERFNGDLIKNINTPIGQDILQIIRTFKGKDIKHIRDFEPEKYN